MTRGMLTLDELRPKVDAGEIDTVILAFSDHYGRLHGKRFDATFFVEEVCKSGTHACDYLLTVDMEMNPVAGYRYASWEQGYGDFHMVPDLDTMRVASWLDRTALVLHPAHLDGKAGTLGLETVAALAKSRGVPVLVDAAYMNYPTKIMGGYMRRGADMVAVSAKYFGGPNAGGFILGRPDLIAAVSNVDFTRYESGKHLKFGRPLKLDRRRNGGARGMAPHGSPGAPRRLSPAGGGAPRHAG